MARETTRRETMKELNSDGYVVCQIGGPIYAVAQTREMAIAHYYEDCGDVRSQ